MAINGLNAALSGLQANQSRQNVAANAIANANTEGFRAAEVQSADAADINAIGQGTRITGAYSPPRQSPATPSAVSDPRNVREPSSTDMVRERINQISAQQAYGANLAMYRTAEQAGQTLLDLKK